MKESVMVFSKFFSFVSKLFPVELISTVLHIGSLSAWQRPWASFIGYAAIHVAILYHLSFLKLSIFAIKNSKSMVILMSPILFFVVFLTLIAILAVFLYNLRSNADDDKVVIDAMIGPMFLVIFAFPGIISLRDFGNSTVGILCNSAFECGTAPYNVVSSLTMYVIPFIIFVAIDHCKFWPSEQLTSNFGGAFSKIGDVLITSCYCCIFIYLFSFLAMKLELAKVVFYIKGIIVNLDNHLIILFKEFRIYSKNINIDDIVDKIKSLKG